MSQENLIDYEVSPAFAREFRRRGYTVPEDLIRGPQPEFAELLADRTSDQEVVELRQRVEYLNSRLEDLLRRAEAGDEIKRQNREQSAGQGMTPKPPITTPREATPATRTNTAPSQSRGGTIDL